MCCFLMTLDHAPLFFFLLKQFFCQCERVVTHRTHVRIKQHQTAATGDQTCSTQSTKFVAQLPHRHAWIFDD